jgi:hypothetical protein
MLKNEIEKKNLKYTKRIRKVAIKRTRIKIETQNKFYL